MPRGETRPGGLAPRDTTPFPAILARAREDGPILMDAVQTLGLATLSKRAAYAQSFEETGDRAQLDAALALAAPTATDYIEAFKRTGENVYLDKALAVLKEEARKA